MVDIAHLKSKLGFVHVFFILVLAQVSNVAPGPLVTKNATSFALTV
jgi:hypothetical protein